MKLKVMLSVALFVVSDIATARATPYDLLVKKIHDTFEQFGDIAWTMRSPSMTAPIVYFKMKNLNFPGGSFPVVFAITCAQTNTKDVATTNYFCTASPPGSVGVPSSFPTAFSVDIPQ